MISISTPLKNSCEFHEAVAVHYRYCLRKHYSGLIEHTERRRITGILLLTLLISIPQDADLSFIHCN